MVDHCNKIYIQELQLKKKKNNSHIQTCNLSPWCMWRADLKLLFTRLKVTTSLWLKSKGRNEVMLLTHRSEKPELNILRTRTGSCQRGKKIEHDRHWTYCLRRVRQLWGKFRQFSPLEHITREQGWKESIYKCTTLGPGDLQRVPDIT